MWLGRPEIFDRWLGRTAVRCPAMKNLIILGMVLCALFYAQRSCSPPGEQVTAPKPTGDAVSVGGPARQWEQAPNAVMDMQGAMGGARSGAARAARDALRTDIGLTLALAQNTALFASFNGEFSNTSTMIAGTAGARITW